MHDALLIKMLHTLFLEKFAIENFVLKINFLGHVADRQQYSQALQEFLQAKIAQLCQTCQTRLTTNVLRILDCKSESCQHAVQDGPTLQDYFADETKAEWQLLCDTLHELSVTFVHDVRLVRGLDYYNKTVFEFVSDALGAQSAFCAGGRYDGLAEQLGSKQSVPALGCAIGMERLMLILQEQREQLSLPEDSLVCIIPFSQEQNKLGLLLADHLQSHGKTVDVLVDEQKIKNKMKKAHNMGSSFVLLLGETEQANNTVTVKNMTTGEEQVVSQAEIHKVV